MKRKEEIRGILSGLAAAVFFLAAFLGLHWNFFVCAVLSAGLFEAVYLLSRPQRKIGKISIGELENGEELEQKLREAREDFESIRRSMKQIEDAELKAQSERLHGTAARILKYLEKHPEKINMARRFIDYYQDTASSLLGKYVELQDSSLETEEARRLKDETKGAIRTLNSAFEQQFQRLMGSEMLDMDAEIKLIEKMRKMEGMS